MGLCNVFFRKSSSNETKETEHVNSYISYKLKIGDFITNYGYSVITDANGKVQQIIDFTNKNYTENQLNALKEAENNDISENDMNVYLNRAKQNINNNDDILEEEITFYYDLEKNEKTAIVTLKIKDDITGHKLKTYTYDMTNSIM